MNQQISGNTVIPEKIYFRIGEVSDLVGVDPHVLRYWETEFNIIKPRRAKSNQRLYRKKDVEYLLLIKTLLHGKGYTIAGARKLIGKGIQAEGPVLPENGKSSQKPDKQLTEIKKELLKIQQLLALKSLRY
ncbi:MAG: MerR family transcriptional regulator [Desulfobulbaceae bacterium]|nr:MerR family transcriptional regulator [Desulfobulbaceae bacterium]